LDRVEHAVQTAIEKDEKAALSFLGRLPVPPFQGLGNLWDDLPRASLADSLCPGLLSFGLSALLSLDFGAFILLRPEVLSR